MVDKCQKQRNSAKGAVLRFLFHLNKNILIFFVSVRCDEYHKNQSLELSTVAACCALFRKMFHRHTSATNATHPYRGVAVLRCPVAVGGEGRINGIDDRVITIFPLWYIRGF